MFKKLLQNIKNFFLRSAPKSVTANPIAAKMIKDVVKEAEQIADVLDKSAKDVEKELREAFHEIKAVTTKTSSKKKVSNNSKKSPVSKKTK